MANDIILVIYSAPFPDFAIQESEKRTFCSLSICTLWGQCELSHEKKTGMPIVLVGKGVH